MKVGTVSGTVVSTIKSAFFDSRKLMICDLIDADGYIDGYTIAVDVVGAGVGETVLILDEGNSARQIFGLDTGPIRAVIVGIVDDVDINYPPDPADKL
ncbi:MAG: EutN/CcmL family microcompartment protein [bacterium]|nr:EutN/CcmL family microcompartment protein [bacterium]